MCDVNVLSFILRLRRSHSATVCARPGPPARCQCDGVQRRMRERFGAYPVGRARREHKLAKGIEREAVDLGRVRLDRVRRRRVRRRPRVPAEGLSNRAPGQWREGPV